MPSPLRRMRLGSRNLSSCLSFFTDDQIKKLVRFSGCGFFERQLHLLIFILLDTGCRIREATGPRVVEAQALRPFKGSSATRLDAAASLPNTTGTPGRASAPRESTLYKSMSG